MVRKATHTGRRTFIKGAGALAGASFVGSVTAADDGSSKNRASERVVGYYPNWASEYTPEDVPWDIVTDINYAFFRPQPDGSVTPPSGFNEHLVEGLAEASDESTSLLFSISGGWYPQEFSDAALTEERRERFAETALEHVREYDFDGIDIDWEYPDGTTRQEDPQNLTLLLNQIRETFDEAEEEDGQSYELSMAVSANTNTSGALEVEQFADAMDHVNVMNYDFHGSWDSRTHFNAPLYPVPDAPNAYPEFTCDYAMQWWADQPIANEKLTFGLPFYGRAMENVENEHPSDHGLFQPFEGGAAVTHGEIQDLRDDPDYQYHWHPEARAPWLYSEAEDRFIGYDNEHSIMEKTKYVVDNGFGGMMCWELTQDPDNVLLQTIDRHNSHP